MESSADKFELLRCGAGHQQQGAVVGIRYKFNLGTYGDKKLFSLISTFLLEKMLHSKSKVG